MSRPFKVGDRVLAQSETWKSEELYAATVVRVDPILNQRPDAQEVFVRFDDTVHGETFWCAPSEEFVRHMDIEGCAAAGELEPLRRPCEDAFTDLAKAHALLDAVLGVPDDSAGRKPLFHRIVELGRKYAPETIDWKGVESCIRDHFATKAATASVEARAQVDQDEEDRRRGAAARAAARPFAVGDRVLSRRAGDSTVTWHPGAVICVEPHIHSGGQIVFIRFDDPHLSNERWIAPDRTYIRHDGDRT